MTEPLPYVVKLRTVAGDDAPPVISEWRGLAYSPIDACTQAMVQLLGIGGITSQQSSVEAVGPDLEAWRKLRAEEKKQEAKK